MDTLISDVTEQVAAFLAQVAPSVVAGAEWTYGVTGKILLVLLAVFGTRFAYQALKNLLTSVRSNFEDEPFYTFCTLVLFLFVLSGLIVSAQSV